VLIVGLYLAIIGLCFGSFVNALVWRLHEQGKTAKSKTLKSKKALSILNGRSMCVHCHHQLAKKDLVPVYSWLSLGGKCRYCRKPISVQYPVVELLTASLFVLSYIFWPNGFSSQGSVLFIFWLIFLVGFVAMAVYDLKWYLLPNRIIVPLTLLALFQTAIMIILFHGGMSAIREAFFGILVGGGIFYILFQVSKGAWIGGGDVKLGALLGLVIGGPAASLLMLFIASLLGSLVAVPLLVSGRVKRTSRLPFGPFLITASIIVYLFGTSIISWYRRRILMY